MGEKPCPVCDILDNHYSPTSALAYGVALGAAFTDMHSVTELMCAKHRTPYVIGMVQAQIAVNTHPDEACRIDDVGGGEG